MHYIVLDLEWNQPETYDETIRTPVLLRGEIIQIGAVKLDASLRRVATYNLLIKPRYYRRMRPSVRMLTGITDADLQRGTPFGMAVSAFRRFCGSDAVLLTWGGMDLPMLLANLHVHGIDSDWIPACYDLQMLFYDQISKEKRQFSLEDAAELLGEPPFEAHDALNDAECTARICRHMKIEEGIAEYERICASFPPLLPPTDRLFEDELAPITYPDYRSGLSDPRNLQMVCPKCEGIVAFAAEYLPNAGRYVRFGTCTCGGDYCIQLRFRRLPDGNYRACRLTYELTEERRTYFAERKAKLDERRERYLQMKNGTDGEA